MGLKATIINLLLTALLILSPFLLLRLARFYFEVIEPYRKRTSYVIDYFGGREPGDGISVAYYEKDKELHFFSDRDEITFHLPDEDLWDRTMPDFFKGKRQIIQERLRRKLPRKVAIKAISEYSGDRAILYVDNSKVGQEKVLKIGQAA